MPRRVLVTGAAVRFGAACAHAFAEAGWAVVCHYNRSADAAAELVRCIEAGGGMASLARCDLADPAARRRLIAEQIDCFGAIDAVVNSASAFEPDTALEMDVQLLRAMHAVNVEAPLDLARWAVALQPERPDDAPVAVVHVLDQKVYNLNPDYFSYTLSKLALERAVALQAQALAPRARVCGLAPGLMYQSGPQTADNLAAASRINLLHRPIDPAAVADAARFLAENPAITGSVLTVDNGQHLVPLERDVMFAVEDWKWSARP